MDIKEFCEMHLGRALREHEVDFLKQVENAKSKGHHLTVVNGWRGHRRFIQVADRFYQTDVSKTNR